VLTFYPSENFKKDGRKREFKVLGDMRAFFRDSNSQKFRQRFFDMPMQYFYQNGYAHASYLMHAQQLVAQQMPKMCAKIALLAGAVSLLYAILLEKNTALGLAGLLCICIALLLLMRLWELSIPLFKDVWENYALKSSSFPDFPDNFKRAKIGRLEDARIFSAYSWTVLRLATQTPAKEALMAKDTQLLGITLALPIMALLWPKTGIGEIVSASGLAWGIWQVRMQLPEFQKTYSLMKEVMRLNDEYKHTAVESPPLLNMEESLPSPLLAIKNLHFDFQAGTATAINGLDLTLEKGELLGIVGKSGSGKSALAQLLAGLHQPQSGEIRLFGRPFSEWPAAQRAQVIGLVVQQAPLFAGSVRDNIGSYGLSDEALLRTMQTACIEEGTISLDDTVQDRGKNFTHSQRQRLELARALARQPKLLILDEATNGMPSALERQILQNIKEMSIACLFVTHRLDNTDVLDCVLEMRNGAAGELA
jgi:ABC-type bacteriocin/lantibiotic exporter with double-glycine peptidase domain